MQELEGRVAVITGAGSGVGRGLAQGFAEAGARLALADVDTDGLEETRQLLGSSVESIAVKTDVTSQASVDALAGRALDAFGAVHVLCNNAGVAFGGYLWEHSLEDWDWIVDVNVRGVIHGIRTFVPIFLEGGEEAHVVNTSSMLGLYAAPLTGPYVMTKHAVLALSESLRLDLQTKGANVGVSVLCPGPVKTRVNEERGRPARTKPPGEPDPQIAANAVAMRGIIANGMEPAEVGRCVVDGVRSGRFYLFPSPEYVPGARIRMNEIEREQESS
jgi:NAD(P)-dependent dehydrogenase (short-subunit alcohol dehydrogenase family)